MIKHKTISCVSPMLVVLFTLGCVKRNILITTEPSGALVWVNDREVGKTPIEIDFLYYGEYDVRIEKSGKEPIMTAKYPQRPFWDVPVIDFVAEVSPFTFESNTTWHFNLETRNDDADLLIHRAKEIREMAAGNGEK